MDSSKDCLENVEILLVISPPERLKDNNIELIRRLTENDREILIITSSQPSQYLHELYEAKGIDSGKISFIDTITKFAMGTVPDGVQRCRFLSSPSDLTSLSIAISESLKEIKEKKPALLIDSLNAMLIYLPSSDITKFMHFLTSKLRIMFLSGIYLAAEDSLDPKIMSQIMTFTDRVINMDSESDSDSETDSKEKDIN